MPLYEDRTNSENQILVKRETKDSIVAGNIEVSNLILEIYTSQKTKKSRKVVIALDGWYGVNWNATLEILLQQVVSLGIKVSVENFSKVYKSPKEIEEYKKPFLTDDPGFGFSNTNGKIEDILDESKISALKNKL